MLLEDKIIYEIKKENIFRVLKEDVLSLCKELKYLERKMIAEGYAREDINLVCRDLIDESDAKFNQRLINENLFSSLTGGALGHLLPGVSSYFKLQLVNYICRKLGISLDSPFKRFLRNVVKNIKFTELYGYFEEGKCSLIIETLMGAVLDQLVEFIILELGKAGIDSDSSDADPDAGYIEQLGDKMIEAGLSEEVLQFFGDFENKLPQGMLVQVIEDHIKRYLAPPLIRSISSIVCDGLSFKEISTEVEDSFKSTTKKEAERKVSEKNAAEKRIADRAARKMSRRIAKG